MKKTLLLFTALFAVSTIYAQRGKVAAASNILDQGDVDGARKRINEALIHEKSKDWARTYVVAGKISIAEFEKTQNVEKLIEASDFFLKSMERDRLGDEAGKGIGKTANEIKMVVTMSTPPIINAGVEAFEAENFILAMRLFEKVSLLNNDKVFWTPGQPEVMDSIFAYYTALSAYKGEVWDKAEEYFNKSIDVKYEGGDAVLLLNEVYAAQKDTVKMINNFKRGSELFPQDDRIILPLVILYIATEQDDEALTYLDASISKMPNNENFYFARGFLYENKKDIDEAEKNYLKALEINPEYYEALIELGIIYFNKGAEHTQYAITLDLQRDYDAAMAKAHEYFVQSLPFVERADKAKPNNEIVLDTLKSLYYRLQMMDKYEEVDIKLQNIKQN